MVIGRSAREVSDVEVYTKECERCGEAFKTHARIGKRQRVCSQSACLEWREKESKRAWIRGNREYYTGTVGRRDPGYWKGYRERHPESEERNRAQTRERMRQRRALFATQDSIRQDPVGYLEGLRGVEMFATQDSILGCIDGILTYLRTPGVFATQDSIDKAGPWPG